MRGKAGLAPYRAIQQQGESFTSGKYEIGQKAYSQQ